MHALRDNNNNNNNNNTNGGGGGGGGGGTLVAGRHNNTDNNIDNNNDNNIDNIMGSANGTSVLSVVRLLTRHLDSLGEINGLSKRMYERLVPQIELAEETIFEVS
jgi:hypothetical protein